MSLLSIFESMSDPVFVATADGETLETNAAFDRVFGPAQDSASIFDLWPELKSIWRSEFGSITQGHSLRIDVLASDQSGSQLIFDVRLFSFTRPDPGQANLPTGVAGVCRDVTRDREDTRQLELRATTDDLTGVFSRNQLGVLLDLEIRSAVRRKSKGCFLYLDIDGFKQLNDRFGHAEGDRVLKKVAALLEEHLRAADVVARLGGDEFGVILVDASLEHGLEKSRQLVGLLNDVTAGEDATARDKRITVAVGVAEYPDRESDVSEIIRRADAAMYRAKRNAEDGVAAWVSD